MVAYLFVGWRNNIIIFDFADFIRYPSLGVSIHKGIYGEYRA